MINRTFKNNWLQILKINSNLSIIQDPEKVEDLVRIPLTPFKIRAYDFYHLFELLYLHFINDQPNTLDIIVSDYDIENITFEVFLYEMRIAAIHESVESIPKGLLKIKQDNLTNLNKLFKRIQSIILQERGIKIGSFRIIKRRALDVLNRHCEKLENASIFEIMQSLLDFIQIIFQNELIYIYPEPIIFRFIKQVCLMIPSVKFSSVLTFIINYIPDFNSAFLLDSQHNKILCKIQKLYTNNLNPQLNMEFLDLNEDSTSFEIVRLKEVLRRIRAELKTNNIFYFKLNMLVTYLTELCELEYPVEKERVKLLLQKFLYGFRSYEEHWDLSPRPKIYSTLVRFLLRIIGLNFNFEKISYWAIPDLIFGIIAPYLGLNARLLIHFTDNNIIERTLIVEVENSAIINLIQIKNEEISTDLTKRPLNSTTVELNEKYGFITTVIKVDKIVIQRFLNLFFFRFDKLTPFKIIQFVKILRKDQFFQIYPELPPYNLFKEKGMLSFLKIFQAVLIDKHEH